jgi:hypothetical protein
VTTPSSNFSQELLQKLSCKQLETLFDQEPQENFKKLFEVFLQTHGGHSNFIQISSITQTSIIPIFHIDHINSPISQSNKNFELNLS